MDEKRYLKVGGGRCADGEEWEKSESITETKNHKMSGYNRFVREMGSSIYPHPSVDGSLAVSVCYRNKNYKIKKLNSISSLIWHADSAEEQMCPEEKLDFPVWHMFYNW